MRLLAPFVEAINLFSLSLVFMLVRHIHIKFTVLCGAKQSHR